MLQYLWPDSLTGKLVSLFAAAVVFMVVQTLYDMFTTKPALVLTRQPRQIGDITMDSLESYDGRDPGRPILLAIRGKVYDVTEGREFYGPRNAYHVYAGRECSRALGRMTLDEKDCSDDLADLTEKQLETLHDWEVKLEKKYAVVGKVVPPRKLTERQLAAFNGSDSSKPMYLAIKDLIFDVSTGTEFYGPDGVYPFAGRQCARAFAMNSTELTDCTDNLADLSRMELQNLQDWEAKFYFKYPIIGHLVS